MDRQRPAFVSYARADSPFAQRLAADLKSNGAYVWLDQLDIRPGRQWDREVELALGTSNELLVVLSPTAVESNNVMDEVAFALEEHKVVIPVLLADCRIPFRLRRYQYIDFRSDYQSALQTLLSVLALDKPAIPEVVKELVDSPQVASENTRAAAAVAPLVESVAPATERSEADPVQKQERVNEERTARKLAARELAVRDQAARELAAREQAIRDQAAQDLSLRHRVAREQAKEEGKRQELAEQAFWSPRIKAMLGRLEGCPDFYRSPAIPPQMLSRAQAISLAPPSEEAFGMVYCQTFLGTPSFLLFTESGVYVHSRQTRSRIAYAELREMKITAENDRTLEFGRMEIAIPARFSMQVLADALNTLKNNQ